MFLSEKRWLCRLDYLLALASFVKNANKEALFKIKEDANPTTPQLERKNNEAHLYIYGPLVSDPDPYVIWYSQYYTTYQSIQSDLDIVKDNLADIDKVYLHINSPGGTVEGVDDTWKMIREISEEKEVIAINEGDIASAAYWLASAANKIVATSDTNEQGSIGVIAGYIDWSEADKKAGIQEKIFVSKNAKYKHPVQSGYDEKLQETLDNLEDIFISRISEGRGLTKDKIYASFGQGSMMLSKEALTAKMIDEIVPKTSLFSGRSDAPTAAINSKNGDRIMTLAEMLNDPGVLAEIAKREAAAKELGKNEAFKAVRQCIPVLESQEYPKYIKDAALKVCEGVEPQAKLDGMLIAHDQHKAEWEARKSEQDEANQEPTPGVKPNFVEPTSRSVEDRVRAIRKLEGKE